MTTEVKAIIIGSGGFLGKLRFSYFFTFPLMREEITKTAKFGAALDKLTIATLFVNACKAELDIDGEKVAQLEAKYKNVNTKTVALKNGDGIPTEGENRYIELKCKHYAGSGVKYAACATIVGIKE